VTLRLFSAIVLVRISQCRFNKAGPPASSKNNRQLLDRQVLRCGQGMFTCDRGVNKFFKTLAKLASTCSSVFSLAKSESSWPKNIERVSERRKNSPDWRVGLYFYSPILNSTRIWRVGEWLSALLPVSSKASLLEDAACTTQPTVSCSWCSI
jgi:hypothetical protein